MGILHELFKQGLKKPDTNPFPVVYAPDTATLMKVKNGDIPISALAQPVPIPEGFRGRVHYYKNRCIGCKSCLKVCPSKAIEYIPEEKKIKIYVARCTFCQMCVDICPPNASALKMGNESAFDFLLADYDPYTDALITVEDEDPDPGFIERQKKAAAEKKAALLKSIQAKKAAAAAKPAQAEAEKPVAPKPREPPVVTPAEAEEVEEILGEEGICIYCGSFEEIHKAHLIAPSKGGKKKVFACAKCNTSKGDKALMEWLRWVQENRPQRWELMTAYNQGKEGEVAEKILRIHAEGEKDPAQAEPMVASPVEEPSRKGSDDDIPEASMED